MEPIAAKKRKLSSSTDSAGADDGLATSGENLSRAALIYYKFLSAQISIPRDLLL